MTRDDMLRELELLPMWKLRAPVSTVLPTIVEAKLTETVEIEPIISSLDVANDEPEKLPVIQAFSLSQVEITLSQDKNWAFVYEVFDDNDLASQSSGYSTGQTSIPANHVDIGLQVNLLNNMMQALHIDKFSKMNNQNLNNIDAKIIVAFGQNVAQHLLKSQEKLENLQGKLYAIDDSQLIATHALSHLLAYPQCKAPLWQDMCLARSYLQNLHS